MGLASLPLPHAPHNCPSFPPLPQTVTFLRSSWDWLPSLLDTVVSNVDQISSAPSFDLEPPSNIPEPVKDLFQDAACEALAYQIRETQEGRFALRYAIETSPIGQRCV